jgi:SAM-dependent methyltransferase
MSPSVGRRRKLYRELIPLLFDVTAELYYTHWGESFHLAVFEEGDDPGDFASAWERTHERYFKTIEGDKAGRILELATGGGSFAAWMADHTEGEVLGVDISMVQLAHATRLLALRPRGNLRFRRFDVMRIAELDEAPFDAAVCLDAMCYLPDRCAALAGIATRLRPGGRLLVVDWCCAEQPTGLQRELILEPLQRYWRVAELETISGYERAFAAGPFHLLAVDDLSPKVRPNWERGYQAAQAAVAETPAPDRLVAVTARALLAGPEGLRLLKEQFYAALFAKIAADAGVLRYVSILAERQ